MTRIQITKRGVDRLRSGHPWIYRSDLFAETSEGAESGEVVRVDDAQGRPVGTAFYSARSQIALRFLSREEVDVDAAFLRARLATAISLRERLFPGGRWMRLVHGEADLLPGLVVDRYGSHLSIQTLIPGTDRRKELICDLLEELISPEGIVERNDARSRRLEGLELRKGVVRGSYQPPSSYEEGEARLEVDLIEGQKTGAFLDQRENHLKARAYGEGACLDLFSYGGGFALQLAAGATTVKAVEISEQACSRIERNAEASGAANVEVICANVFDWLRDELAAGKRYDTIVLDPPAFAKNKASLAAALRGYKEVNLRALQLLSPGGILLSFTCSYHVSAETFEKVIVDAARDARREPQLLERLGAGRDHPVLMTAPETHYLKGLVLRVP